MAIGFVFTCPVTNFLGNGEVLIVVLYCSLEFFKALISKAEIAIGTSFTCPKEQKEQKVAKRFNRKGKRLAKCRKYFR